MQIHPSAIVHPRAILGEGVEVGPFCVIGEHVTIGPQTVLQSHVTVDGWTEIGARCTIHSYAAIGFPPQHLHYKGEPTRVVIGNDNILREYVTVHRATVEGGGVTTIGDHNFLMAYSHVAHDCRLGNHIIMANAASLGGHITVGNHAVIGGLSGVHQYVRIGDFAMVGGCSGVAQDVPPFFRAAGYRARLFGLNSVGLRRHGFTTERVSSLKQAYRLLFRSGLRLAEATKRVGEQFQANQDVKQLLTFVEGSKRGICRSTSGDEEESE